MTRQHLRLGAAALLAVVVLLRLGSLGRNPGQLDSRDRAARLAPAQATLPASAREEPSSLADGLLSSSGDVHSDLRIIDEIFIAYRSALRMENPVGENAEITAALAGKNRLGFAFIPRGCPKINARGELCDRWGRPYFFHQISGERMEIRSAGPDGKLWTADDEVLTP